MRDRSHKPVRRQRIGDRREAAWGFVRVATARLRRLRSGRQAQIAPLTSPSMRLRMLGQLLVIGSLLAAGLASGQPGERPGVFLQGASVPRAKGLALDAALIKGWYVAQSEPNHVIFETTLEEPASFGPPNAIAPEQTLLRIRADFVETPAGVNAYLYAEEIWYAGTPKEWVTDVTPQYRRNLANALSSLQTQWAKIATAKSRDGGSGLDAATGAVPDSGSTADAGFGDTTTAVAAEPKIRVAPIPEAPPSMSNPLPQSQPQLQVPTAPAAPAIVEVEVGTWAYHAEEFAIGRGCTLDDLGAELISGDSASELHRVHCQGNSSVLVRCDREQCYGAQ